MTRGQVHTSPGFPRLRRAGRALPPLAAGALAAGAFLIGPASGMAAAEAPSGAGWWTRANPGSVEGSPAAPAPPDVPAGGLLVEGGMGSASGASDAGATAFGAVVYLVPPGQRAGTLTLDVAPGSGTTPAATLELCPLSSPAINAEQGGPMTDAPTFSCATDVTAQPSAAGNSYSFDVSRFFRDGGVAVAVLPTSPTDRVVLTRPTGASLSVRPSGAAAAPAQGPAATGSDGGSAPAPGGDPGATSTAAPGASDPSSPGAVLPDPATSLAPAPAGSLPAASAPQLPRAAGTSSPAAAVSSSGSAGQAPAPVPPSSGTGGARPAAVAALVVGFLIGAAIWLGAGRAAARAAARGGTG